MNGTSSRRLVANDGLSVVTNPENTWATCLTPSSETVQSGASALLAAEPGHVVLDVHRHPP